MSSTKERWISVKKHGQPKEYGFYLVSFPLNQMNHHRSSDTKELSVHECVWAKSNKWYTPFCADVTNAVTHYRNIPAPPKTNKR